MYQTKKNPLRVLPGGFGHALTGIRSFIAAEKNARFHGLATVAVLGLSWILHNTPGEWIAVGMAIGFVWVAEMFNTCIEKVMDFISKERRAEIRFIKDIAAGAVLVASLTALATCLLIFIPKLGI